MYNIGDYIMYGTSGVCKVNTIGAPAIAIGDRQDDYYQLEPVYSAGVIFTPVNTKVFIRPVMKKANALSLVEKFSDDLPELSPKVKQNAKDYYESLLATHHCSDLVLLIKTIYVKNNITIEHGRKLGGIDLKYLKQAEELLYGELSISLGVEKAMIKAKLERVLSDMITATLQLQA